VVRARTAAGTTHSAGGPQAAAPTRPTSAIRAFIVAHWTGLACAVILLLLAVSMVRGLSYHTLTTDETVHIPAGYAYWNRHDFGPNNEHPPLAKLWATAPWLILNPPEPPPFPTPTPAKRTIDTGRYFWQLNVGQMADLLFWARVPMIAITIGLGGLIYWCGRRLFNARAGLLAVALFSLEPTIQAHGWIVHTDIPASTAYLGWWAALAIYATRPSLRRAIILGLVSGAAVSTKYNLLVLLQLGLLALGILWLVAPRRGDKRLPIIGHGAIIAVLILLVINAVYFFGHQPLTNTDINWLRQEDPARAELVLTIMRILSPIVPPYYQLGTYTVLTHNAEGHPAGLLGEFSSQGWWYYFPVAFTLKTALPVLILTITGIGWAVWRMVRARDWRFLLLIGPMFIFAASTMSSHINIGVRHFLPVFPFCFLLGGALLDRLLGRLGQARQGRRVALTPQLLVGPAIVALLLGWLVVESVRAYPDDLTYMNQLASAEPHWYYLSDSNVEWGQDVGALAAYLRQQGETTVREAIATPETLSYLGVTPLDLFSPETASAPPTRYVAIGASFLNGSVIDATKPGSNQDDFAPYRLRIPEMIFGGSIYLYRTDTLPNPPALSAPLSDGAYRATIAIRDQPEHLRVGEKEILRLRVTNSGPVPWPVTDKAKLPNQLRLGNRWFATDSGALVQDDSREPLAFPILPGETGDLELRITAPGQAGTYTLEVDLVQEGVAWFGARGGTPLRITIRVVP
jgi:hypothetical protein